MESFPVVLRCEDICVAVPITILIKESTVFKTMFGINDRYVTFHNYWVKNTIITNIIWLSKNIIFIPLFNFIKIFHLYNKSG